MIKIPGLFTIELKKIILPIVFIVVGVVVYGVLKRIITKLSLRNTSKLKGEQLQRIQTVNMLIINIIKYVIVIVVVLAILALFGVNVNSLVAGLGVTAAIVGLAFQDLAKDLIAGIFIITEGQYEVGDTVEVDGFMGEVVSLGLKTTQIRNYKGATKIIGNHYMDNMINYSLHNSLAVVDVGTDYAHSPEEIEKVLTKLAQELNGNIKEAKGDIQIWGINELDDSAVIYRVAVEVNSMKQFEVERFLRKKIKETFDKENIKIPFPQVEVHNGKK